MSVYKAMSNRELEAECNRLKVMAVKYAKAGLAVMTHSYECKLIAATAELNTRNKEA